ncbi:3808_t:CDS:2 [Gigaspora margarita]|uniref:3808_t:CDS:1 n=1 Tax=Gigaspora margarita TaxID=4874 RepID=A0ABM8VXR9_GIGMA|nr:3808_t:CDS:2 [Gigaspora margarita]
MVRLINNFALVCLEDQPALDALTVGNTSVSNTFSFTLTLHQNDCKCDFRINAYGCPESKTILNMYYALLAITILNILVSGCFIYSRIFIRKQPVWFAPTRNRGILRPRPQDAFHIITVVYGSSQIIHIILLITSTYPNTITAEIGQDIPRLIGFGLAVLLPVSIAYLTGFYADNGAPPLSSSGSYLSETEDSMITRENATLLANKYFKIHYLIWSAWGCFYVMIVVYFWYKLSLILRVHMRELKERQLSGDYDVEWKVKMIVRAIKNLSIIAATFIITNGSYTLTAFAYGLWQHNITIFIFGIDLFYLIIWYFSFPILLSITQAVFIYNTYNPTPNGPTFTHISTTSSTVGNGDSLSNYDRRIDYRLIKAINGSKFFPLIRNKPSSDTIDSKTTAMSSDQTLQESKFNESEFVGGAGTIKTDQF